MKTVISSSQNDINADFDKRFGRAAWFCVLDEESGKTDFVENLNKDANNGAGTKVAEKMAVLGVSKVISGHFGPKAKDMLDELNIQMVVIQEDGLSVKNIIDKLSA